MERKKKRGRERREREWREREIRLRRGEERMKERSGTREGKFGFAETAKVREGQLEEIVMILEKKFLSFSVHYLSFFFHLHSGPFR